MQVIRHAGSAATSVTTAFNYLDYVCPFSSRLFALGGRAQDCSGRMNFSRFTKDKLLISKCGSCLIEVVALRPCLAWIISQVYDHKAAGYFCDSLVNATADTISGLYYNRVLQCGIFNL
jgi:hypothetical protein